MINLDAFKVAINKFSKNDMPFLSELRAKAKREKPYQNLKLLHNIPLTIEAVIKMEALVLGGADVTASCITFLEPHAEALSVLKAANIKVQVEHAFDDDYDFGLDCCGELVNLLTPRIGAVELTQTGSEIYKRAAPSYPVISVDDSKIKFLETLFGTGDGFLRAFLQATHSAIYDKKFVIFGYGKVGKGIAHALIKFTDNIVIIDSNPEARLSAIKRGISAIDPENTEKIKSVIGQAYCIVTATGIRDLLSEIYQLQKTDFKNAILTNMGGVDEYGRNFEYQDVLFDKKPINFCITEPTTMKYLDPILYAHNISIDLILSGNMQNRYNQFPNDLALAILDKWAYLHHENFTDLEQYINN